MKLITIMLLLCMITNENLLLEQTDMKAAFHHGDLEDIYIEKPQHFVHQSNNELVCKLQKICMV